MRTIRCCLWAVMTFAVVTLFVVVVSPFVGGLAVKEFWNEWE